MTSVPKRGVVRGVRGAVRLAAGAVLWLAAGAAVGAEEKGAGEFAPRAGVPDVELLQPPSPFPPESSPKLEWLRPPTLQELFAKPPLDFPPPFPELLQKPPPPPRTLRPEQMERRFSGEVPGKVTGLGFSPDGRLLCVATDRGFLGIWSTFSGKRLAAIRRRDGAEIRFAVVTFDSRKVVAAGGGEVWMWDPFDAAPGKSWRYGPLDPHAVIRTFGKPERLVVMGRIPVGAGAADKSPAVPGKGPGGRIVGNACAVVHDLTNDSVEVIRPPVPGRDVTLPPPSTDSFQWGIASAGTNATMRLYALDGGRLLLAEIGKKTPFAVLKRNGVDRPIRMAGLIPSIRRVRVWDGHEWMGYDLEGYPRNVLPDGRMVETDRLKLDGFREPPRMLDGVDAAAGTTHVAYFGGERLDAWDALRGVKILETSGPAPAVPPTFVRVHGLTRQAASGFDGSFDVYRYPIGELNRPHWNTAYMRAIEHLLTAEKFGELEKEAARIRSAPPDRLRMNDGGDPFWRGLAGGLDERGPADRVPDRTAKLRKYRAAFPKSSVPRIALGDLLFHRSYIEWYDPKDPGRKRARATQDEARLVLQEALDLEPPDTHAWIVVLKLIRFGAIPHDTRDAILAEIRKRDPADPHHLRELYFDEGGGDPQEVAALAARETAETRDPDQRAEIRGRLAHRAMADDDGIVPERYGFKTEELQRDVQRLENLYPWDGHWPVMAAKLHLLRSEVEPALAARERAVRCAPDYTSLKLPMVPSLAALHTDPLIREAEVDLLGDGFACEGVVMSKSGAIAALAGRQVVVRTTESRFAVTEFRFGKSLPTLWSWSSDGRRAVAAATRAPAWLTVLDLDRPAARQDVEIQPRALGLEFVDEHRRIVLRYPDSVSVLDAETLEETALHRGKFGKLEAVSDRPVLRGLKDGKFVEFPLDDPDGVRPLAWKLPKGAELLGPSAGGKKHWLRAGGRLRRLDVAAQTEEDFGPCPPLLGFGETPDGKHLYSLRSDGLHRLDLAAKSTRPVLPLHFAQGWLGFTPDGKRLRTTSLGGGVVLSWPLELLERRAAAGK